MNKITEILEKNPILVWSNDDYGFWRVSTLLDEMTQMDEITFESLFALRRELEVMREITLWANTFSKLLSESVEISHLYFQDQLEESLSVVSGLSQTPGDSFDFSRESLTLKMKYSQIILLLLTQVESILASLQPKIQESKNKRKAKNIKFTLLQRYIQESVKAQTQTQVYAHKINAIILWKNKEQPS